MIKVIVGKYIIDLHGNAVWIEEIVELTASQIEQIKEII